MAKRLIGDIAGFAVVLGASYALYGEYQKSAKSSPTEKQQQQQHQQKQQIVVKENARDFLAKLANSGDEIAAKTVVSATTTPTKVPTLPQNHLKEVDTEPFRFDVTREGLTGALESILETKRSYEMSFLNETRRTGRYPADFTQRCKELREEKEELKRLIKGLEKPKENKWWFF